MYISTKKDKYWQKKKEKYSLALKVSSKKELF